MMECKTCGVEHDDELHAAVERVHSWLRRRLRRALDSPPPPVAKPDALGLVAVSSLRSPASKAKAQKGTNVRIES
jgi:hypothetical protein